MSVLAAERIQLGATAVDKSDAIRQVGALLVNSGCVEAGYIEGMLAREETMSTYLGEGVAIPHGTYDNRAQIRHTGIAVLQLPQGVVWEDDDMAYLVIGIAATGDDHVGVLANLAEAIEDEAITAQLIHTTDPNLILTHLGAPASAEM